MKNEKNDGGPAFPRPIGHGTILIAGSPANLEVAPQAGMSLRDYFAGQALANLNLQAHGAKPAAEALAQSAYNIADAMIEGRARQIQNR